jgi:hypothetical protein
LATPLYYINLDTNNETSVNMHQNEESESDSITLFNALGESTSRLSGTRFSRITPDEATPANIPNKKIKVNQSIS